MRKLWRDFEATLASGFPRMRFAAVVEAHDDAEEAYRKTLDVFSAGDAIAGVYVGTSNSPRGLAGAR